MRYSGISLIGAFNLLYYETEAVISSAFTLVCMYYWYRDSLDLYNCFKWTEADEAEANEFKTDRVMQTDATGRVYSDDLGKNGKNQCRVCGRLHSRCPQFRFFALADDYRSRPGRRPNISGQSAHGGRRPARAAVAQTARGGLRGCPTNLVNVCHGGVNTYTRTVIRAVVPFNLTYPSSRFRAEYLLTDSLADNP